MLLGFAAGCEARSLLRFERDFVPYDSGKMELSLIEPLTDAIEFGIHEASSTWVDTTVEWPFDDYDPTSLLDVVLAPDDTLIVVDCPPPETTIDGTDTTLVWNLVLIPTQGGLARINPSESQSDPLITLFEDTSEHYIHPTADAYVIYDSTPAPSLLWIGSGWVLRSGLEFDVSSIPTGSKINRADLMLFVEDAETGSMEVIATVPGTTRSGTGYLYEDSTYVSITITSLLQYWIDQANEGLTLRTSGETDEVSRASFFSSQSPDSQPRIRVLYTESVYEE
jgi:hypothetical protein